ADENLIDYQNWTTIMNGGFRAVEKLGNELYASNRSNSILRFTPQGNTNVVHNFSSEVIRFRLADDLLTITTTNSIQAYAEGFVQEAAVSNVLGFDLNLQSGYGFGNNFYLGTAED